jgi:hypothetical protein
MLRSIRIDATWCGAHNPRLIATWYQQIWLDMSKYRQHPIDLRLIEFTEFRLVSM